MVKQGVITLDQLHAIGEVIKPCCNCEKWYHHGKALLPMQLNVYNFNQHFVLPESVSKGVVP